MPNDYSLHCGNYKSQLDFSKLGVGLLCDSGWKRKYSSGTSLDHNRAVKSHLALRARERSCPPPQRHLSWPLPPPTSPQALKRRGPLLPLAVHLSTFVFLFFVPFCALSSSPLFFAPFCFVPCYHDHRSHSKWLAPWSRDSSQCFMFSTMLCLLLILIII